MKVKQNNNRDDNRSELWRSAIRSARQEIAKSKARIRQLEVSVRVFEENFKSGEPWPGGSARVGNVQPNTKNHVGV